MQVRQAFATRQQCEKEDWMQYRIPTCVQDRLANLIRI